MNDLDEKVDLVCGMRADIDSLNIEYLGSNFYFCSKQCQDRFMANPHLYIGHAGIPSPKQQGMRIIKKRTILLEKNHHNIYSNN